MTMKELNRRQVRWWEVLSPYDLNIVHRPGRENTRADALSRRPDYLKGMKPVSHTILEVDNDDDNERHMTVNRQVNISATLTLQPINIEEQIKEEYKTDIMTQNIIDNNPANFNIMQNRLIEYKGLIYVSNRYV